VTPEHLERENHGPKICDKLRLVQTTDNTNTAEHDRRDVRTILLNHDQYDGQVDPVRKYARRPRHKTRSERYEYKGTMETVQDRRRTGLEKSQSRRRKTIKKGEALNATFKAPNVEPERLSVKHRIQHGIFERGKASGPILPQGIADLTFSEMRFLSKRRLPDSEHHYAQTAEQSSKSKDETARFAKYFGSKNDAPVTRSHRRDEPRAKAVDDLRRGETPGVQDASGNNAKANSSASDTRIPANKASNTTKGQDIPLGSAPKQRHTSSAGSWPTSPARNILSKGWQVHETPAGFGEVDGHRETLKAFPVDRQQHGQIAYGGNISNGNPTLGGSCDQMAVNQSPYYTLQDLMVLAGQFVTVNEEKGQPSQRSATQQPAYDLYTKANVAAIRSVQHTGGMIGQARSPDVMEHPSSFCSHKARGMNTAPRPSMAIADTCMMPWSGYEEQEMTMGCLIYQPGRCLDHDAVPDYQELGTSIDIAGESCLDDFDNALLHGYQTSDQYQDISHNIESQVLLHEKMERHQRHMTPDALDWDNDDHLPTEPYTTNLLRPSLRAESSPSYQGLTKPRILY
jgi:hypothetical protein